MSETELNQDRNPETGSQENKGDNNPAEELFTMDVPETETINPESHLENTEDDIQGLTIRMEQEIEEWKDKYLRLASEFDNYRKRTQKEKTDIIRYGNEELLKSLLPVLDDFERSLEVMDKSDNLSAIQEGVQLVSHKFKNILLSKGLKPMESLHQSFDSDLHEAVTSIPAEKEDMKGKVLDEIEKGYYLGERVIRFAKVIVGA